MTALLLLALYGARAQEACLEPPCTNDVALSLDGEQEDDLYELMAADVRAPYWYEPATDWFFYIARGAVGEAHVAEAALLGLGAALHHGLRTVWVFTLAPVWLYGRRKLGLVSQQSEEPSLTPSTRMLIEKAVQRQMAAAFDEQHRQTNLLRTQLEIAKQAIAQRERDIKGRAQATQALRETLERVLGTACNAAGHPLDEPRP